MVPIPGKFYTFYSTCSKLLYNSDAIGARGPGLVMIHPHTVDQCCGSGSAWILVGWIRIQEGKMTHKNRKKSRIFMFLSTGCSLLRAEGFSCSLGLLYGGLGISKLKFLIKKIEIKFPAINFFSILGHQTLDPDPGSGSGIRIRN